MKVEFVKYEGAGNDFVVVDNRGGECEPTAEWVARLCDRHFGVGADGLMLLERGAVDFAMRYFNADGSQARMCGNGGRCIALFAFQKGIAGENQRFTAADGEHEARILSSDGEAAVVSLRMVEPSLAERAEGGWLVNTGVPHYVVEVADIEDFNVERARELRRWYDANVNFVAHTSEGLKIRTFERGVEGETLACGTGAVAVAVVERAAERAADEIEVHTRGGLLRVCFRGGEVWLTGNARRVFNGQWLMVNGQ